MATNFKTFLGMGSNNERKIIRVGFFISYFLIIIFFAAATECIPFVKIDQLLHAARQYDKKVIVVEGWLHLGLETITIRPNNDQVLQNQI
jgi:hypothetical protein